MSKTVKVKVVKVVIPLYANSNFEFIMKTIAIASKCIQLKYKTRPLLIQVEDQNKEMILNLEIGE